MVGLSETCVAVLQALIGARVAWQTPAQLALAIDRNEEATTDLLCEMDLAGWLEVWDSTEGPLVTLSSLAAERLAVRLVEIGTGPTLRWARLGDPDPPPVRASNVCVGARAATLDFLADPTLSPDLAAERFETASERPKVPANSSANALRIDSLPRPTQLVGIGLSPWPGPDQRSDPGEKCPACGSRKLTPRMYCLYCDRWGLDGQVPKPPTTAMKVQTGVPKASRSVAEEAAFRERERNRRKAKRKRRQQRQLEANRKDADATRANPDRRPTSNSGACSFPPPAPSFAQPPASRSSVSRAER